MWIFGINFKHKMFKTDQGFRDLVRIIPNMLYVKNSWKQLINLHLQER